MGRIGRLYRLKQRVSVKGRIGRLYRYGRVVRVGDKDPAKSEKQA